jgi:hypothetical protein
MAARGDRRRLMRRGLCTSGAIVFAVLSLPLAGCASHHRRAPVAIQERAPSSVSVFMPSRTRLQQRDVGEVFAHQSPEFARRDGLIGVR